MSKRSIKRLINAPVDVVFRALTDIENFPEKNPDIVKVELLTDEKTGVGSRFRETRRMNNKEGSTELECTEYIQDEKVRFVADQGGVIWDSVFFSSPVDGGTELVLEMDARPYKLMPRLMLPLILGMVSKAVESDMDAVKSYCERKAA